MEIDWVDVLVTPLVGAVVGFAVWYFQSRIDALRREQERLHDQRRKVYADILEPFIRMFAGVQDATQHEHAMQQMLSFEYKRTAFEFTLFGADEVVRAFNSMMKYVYSVDPEAGEQPDPRKLMRYWGKFLLELRKNVGNPQTELTPVEMLESQIKGIDEMLRGT